MLGKKTQAAAYIEPMMMARPKQALLALGWMAVMIACSGSDEPGGAPGANHVSLQPHFFEGSFKLSGSVQFAAALPSGTFVQLNLTEDSGFRGGALDTGNELANERLGSSTSTVTWSIDKIGAGSFFVALTADTSGDGSVGEGDVGGYFAGTTDAPAQKREDAQVIDVTGSRSGLDFGAGPMRCLAHWGGACSADDDCRGASCVYQSGIRAVAAPGKCNAGLCGQPTSACAPLNGGPGGTLEETDCFGGP